MGEVMRKKIPYTVQKALQFKPEERTQKDWEVIWLWEENISMKALLELCLLPHQPVEVRALAQEIEKRLK